MTKLLQLILTAATIATASAEPRKARHSDNRNYILRRQQAGLIQGPPTSRIYIGKRQIDVYSNGAMFEKDNLVGFKGR